MLAHRVAFRDDLPRTIQPLDGDGILVWAVRTGEMTPRLQADLNFYLRWWSARGASHQGDVPPPAGAGDELQWIEMEFVDDLPDGIYLEPKRRGAGMVWRIRRGEMTEQLRQDAVELLGGYLTLGRLVQHWDAGPGGPLDH
ncbi:hypothetical protein H3146_05925 [Streptomyces sp. OF3]|uniref:Uncharacterized protein n=1 Tax=Streptomyces alkaliterrae TaxID=2213162 RepID=A0A7W3WIP0_9ACTN|nr:hypothetical protein [Streptomyces alkaliterrae]MBB1252905.1 hypothetical protein [Streptomyces alkaliterrae]